MLDFNKYMMRYGEFGIQALIEHMERFEGVKASSHSTLEDRWAHLMDACAPRAPQMAA